MLRVESCFKTQADLRLPPRLNDQVAEHAVRLALLQILPDRPALSAIRSPLPPPNPGHPCLSSYATQLYSG